MRTASDQCRSWIAAVAAIGTGLLVGAASQPRSAFAPIDRLTTWYGDRSVIDVEVVPALGDPITERGLPRAPPARFRVERAYVDGFSRGRRPGNDLLGFGLDIPTGLPNALFVARLRGEGPPAVPRLSHHEFMLRLMTLNLASAERFAAIAEGGHRLALCRGAEVAPGLYDYDYWRAPGCRPLPGDDHIARFVALYGDRLIEIVCSPPQPGPEALGCTLRFPFDGFAVRVAFNDRYLLRWSDRVDQAIRFLRASQYRG